MFFCVLNQDQIHIIERSDSSHHFSVCGRRFPKFPNNTLSFDEIISDQFCEDCAIFTGGKNANRKKEHDIKNEFIRQVHTDPNSFLKNARMKFLKLKRWVKRSWNHRPIEKSGIKDWNLR